MGISDRRSKFQNFLIGLSSALLLAQSAAPAQAKLGQQIAQESGANKMEEPRQILRTGIDLCETGLSPNTMQVADTIGLTPVLRQIEQSRRNLQDVRDPNSLEHLRARQDLHEAMLKGFQIIQRSSLEIDFTLAEIAAEEEIYSEVLATYIENRDSAITRTNALSFISNGALWAVCEGLAIPTYKHSFYAISSGITGILAGMVPSVASMYALKQVKGKRKTSEVEPNMLAKVFGYPTNIDIEYPRTVWEYLNQSPASDPKSKSRKEQLIDNWIADANIPSFNDRDSKKQLDAITASVAQRKGLSIDTLSVRKVMLEQLASEIMKMKRMLLELAMVLDGQKQFTAYEDKRPKHIGSRDPDFAN